MTTFKEAFGDFKDMNKLNVKKPVTGSKVNKSLNNLKISLDNYYNAAEKMLDSQYNALFSNFKTYEKFPELQKLNRVQKLKKYTNDVKNQLESIKKIKTDYQSIKPQAIDFGINTDDKSLLNIETLENKFKRPISKAADVVQKSEDVAKEVAKTEIQKAKQEDPEASKTTPVSTTTDTPNYGNYSPSGEPSATLQPPVEKTPEIAATTDTPNYGNYNPNGEVAATSSVAKDIPKSEISPEVPEISPEVINKTPEVATPTPSVEPTKVEPQATETPKATTPVSTQKDIKNIKQDAEIQTKISEIIDNFIGKAIKENLQELDEAKIVDFLTDENIAKIKSKNLNVKEIKDLVNKIKQLITSAGYIVGRGKISINDLVPPSQQTSSDNTTFKSPEEQIATKPVEPIEQPQATPVVKSDSIFQPEPQKSSEPTKPPEPTSTPSAITDEIKNKLFTEKNPEQFKALKGHYNTLYNSYIVYKKLNDEINKIKADASMWPAAKERALSEKQKELVPLQQNYNSFYKTYNEYIKTAFPELLNKSLKDVSALIQDYNKKA